MIFWKPPLRPYDHWAEVFVFVFFGLVICCCGLLGVRDQSPGGVRVATFNIEMFPKHERQVEAAFQEIRRLRADVVVVQEIRDPAAFDAARRAHLGDHVGFVHTDLTELKQGVLYDRRRVSLVRTQVHDETMVEPRSRPAFEVVLQPHSGGRPLHVLSLHLQPLTRGLPARERQWRALEPLLQERRAQGAQMIVLGDLNSTEEGDRWRLATLAREYGWSWATELVPCTAYWRRTDGCRGSRLDHILTSMPHTRAKAKGACERVGCQERASCPGYCEEVSDHCPVVLEVRSER